MMKKTIIMVISAVVAVSVLAVNVDLDFDNNQIIDGSDLTIFAFSFGKSVAKGNFVVGDRSNADRSDVNDDGVVDGSDLTVLAFDFGKRVTAQSCSDNTAYGQCSVNKPRYCDNGNLIDNCLRCGCNTGYECVGMSCVLVVAKTCSDGIRNQDETDVDCGGSCTDCGLGKLCLVNSDCLSNNCDGGKCVVTTTQTTNQISQFGITWTFDRSVQYGQFANGDYWVIGPVRIVSKLPAPTGSAETYRHGSMVNPMGRDNSQAYDGRGVQFDQSKAISFPYTLQHGESLVSSISRPEDMPTTGHRGKISDAAILTSLSSMPASGSFRPPYSGSNKPIHNVASLREYLLPNLNPVANTPRLVKQPTDAQADSVERMFERPWLDHTNAWFGQHIHPVNNMEAYGRDIAQQISDGALMLMLDESQVGDKTRLLISYVQLGIDLYGIVDSGGYWNANGGHATGNKWPILFAGIMLGDNSMRSIGSKSGNYINNNGYSAGNMPPDYIRFAEDDQTFYVSQLDVDATRSSAWNPDSRDAQKIRYEVSDISLPEWGIVHASEPYKSNKYWVTAYRLGTTGAPWAGLILAAQIMNARDLWNHDALFDYMDRYVQITADNGAWPGWNPLPFANNMWGTYRRNYGCVWALDNPSDAYSQGHYNCAGVIVRCEQIPSCSQYPNQRALDYDPCKIGCG